MKIEKIKIEDIKPYRNNAKLHPAEQIEQIKKSILEFGNNDPIAIDENNTIIEGHGRYIALKELGYEEVEVIKLSHLSEEQKKAYILVHNKLTMNTGFDIDILNEELEQIKLDMGQFGFDDILDLDIDTLVELEDNPYTKTINIPQYEMIGDEPPIEELYNDEKTQELINEINAANITPQQKKFLIASAQRHIVFNYKNIAEYYAHQDKAMQELMEKSALVIIDFDNAIRNGYVQLSNEIEEMFEDD